MQLVAMLPAYMGLYSLEKMSIWLRRSLWDELECDQLSFFHLGDYLPNTQDYVVSKTGKDSSSLSYYIFHFDGIGMVRLYQHTSQTTVDPELMTQMKKHLHALLTEVLESVVK